VIDEQKTPLQKGVRGYACGAPRTYDYCMFEWNAMIKRW
jgi:hypothetical protein